MTEPKEKARFCPFCNADGQSQPVLAPLARRPISVEDEMPASEHDVRMIYECPLCGYAEEHVEDSSDS